ncbi:hypothetical protein [Gracilibacillus thailandensis]|uniref:Uncharacterized protein n=1 Tax=Gracilibacillus thailandensis TaxID=563735 RepID=A0A6N7QUD0_9BACI|nr:hypothetical protein [Gracilibacillus thailandensis]MRI65144.1 hypothetical protein [Gracilibacillus thailandensis]
MRRRSHRHKKSQYFVHYKYKTEKGDFENSGTYIHDKKRLSYSDVIKLEKEIKRRRETDNLVITNISQL